MKKTSRKYFSEQGAPGGSFGGTNAGSCAFGAPAVQTPQTGLFGSATRMSSWSAQSFAGAPGTAFGGTNAGFAAFGAPAVQTPQTGLFGSATPMSAQNSAAMSFMSAQSSAVACSGPMWSNASAVGTEQAEAPKDILVPVAELQNWTGFWKLEAELADLLDCQLEMLKSTKPQKLVGVEDAVWATALVIAFLKTKVADRRLEWKLMSKKAQGWLASTLKSDISVDELVKEATSVLEATSNAVKPQK